MAEEAKKPPKTVWSGVATSREEALLLCEGVDALEFPVIGIPWGAELYGTDCRLFLDRDDMDEGIIERLLEDSFPFGGVRRFHLVSMKSTLLEQVWGTLLTKPSFVLDID